jgi:hypothetical protein
MYADVGDVREVNPASPGTGLFNVGLFSALVHAAGLHPARRPGFSGAHK